MSSKIPVNFEDKHIYDIVIENSFNKLREQIIMAGLDGKRICIITDDNVSEFYLTEIYDICLKLTSTVTMFAFEAGESSKNLDTVNHLYEALIRHNFDRNDCLIALGGGVTGDLCGFAAATYLRGISFIQIPTSLLAMVDSSIGGKTGVDFASYKNMVGAFHMPKLVYINISTLNSLPDKEFSSGMGEIIKHGLIADSNYYNWLYDHAIDIKKKDSVICEEMISISAKIKKYVVEIDPYEKGIRGILNFGHTLGHAIEKEKNFELSHGACVALGILCAIRICIEKNLLKETDYQKAETILSTYGLPIKVSGIDCDKVIDDTRNDKKMIAGKIKFILLKSIGTAYIDYSVVDKDMEYALRSIYEG